MIVQCHSRSFVLVWRGHPSCSSRLILMNNVLRLASHHRRQPEKLASEQACHQRDTAGAREEADDAVPSSITWRTIIPRIGAKPRTVR